MLPCNHPDRIQITFDDHRLVANAGLVLPATLARRLDLPELVHNHLDLRRATGRANTGDKMMTLVASALAGGGCIAAAGVLRTGGTACHAGRHGQGAIHPGHLPAQLPVGPRPPAGPGEPRVAGTGMAGRSRTGRRAIHHRPRFDHLLGVPPRPPGPAVPGGRRGRSWPRWLLGSDISQGAAGADQPLHLQVQILVLRLSHRDPGVTVERHPAAPLAGMGKSIPSCRGEINRVFQPPPELRQGGIPSRGRKQGCFQPGPPDSATMRQARPSSSAMLAKYTAWGTAPGRRACENEVKRTAGDPG